MGLEKFWVKCAHSGDVLDPAVFPNVPAMGIPGAAVRPTSKSSRPGSVSWGRIQAFLRKSTARDLSFLRASPLPQRYFRPELTKNGKSKRRQ